MRAGADVNVIVRVVAHLVEKEGRNKAAQYKEFMNHMRKLEQNGAHVALLKMNRYMKRSAAGEGPYPDQLVQGDVRFFF